MNSKRIKGVSVIRPIVYGNLSVPLTTKKAQDPDHTHKWTVSVRGANNEDISHFVKKVVFKLHETYPNATRVIESSPFELSETGWGEFEIVIKIYFNPLSGEKPVTLYHHLRLHPYTEDALLAGQNSIQKMKSVVSYNYDEIVFNEPTEEFYEVLLKNTNSLLPAKRTPNQPYCTQTEQEEIERLDAAIRKVQEQQASIKERLLAAERELQQLK
ncbi:uncharacterized protein VTP21DRAFT_4619 [Calcarisporiella thermophila]|uniref:uncharacterized protein n=1 Tax=Calcarisporiella thermophila TaxID=911321 RepID=UPI00374499C5